MHCVAVAVAIAVAVAVMDYHLFSIKFLLESDHFGALAGWGSMFIDF